MIMKYTTKRDINGNRYILEVDFDKKIYAKTPLHWFNREDYIEVTRKDKWKIEEALEKDGFVEWYTLDKENVGGW